METFKLNLKEEDSKKWSDSRITHTKIAVIFNFIHLLITAFAFIFLFMLSLIVLVRGGASESVQVAGFALLGYSFICLIPFAWMIPMTIKLVKAYKSQTSLSVAFCICNLIFVSIVSGIFLLADNKGDSKG